MRSVGLGRIACAALLAGELMACRASVQGRADSSGEARAKSDAFAEFDERALEDERGQVGEFAVAPTPAPAGPTLLGARHDLFLKPDAPITCRCLAVFAGPADDVHFGWEAQLPALDAQRELALAFRSESCPEAGADSLGASYRGYRTSEQGDVIVMVEAARAGRPQPGGAIVPRPTGQGRVLLEPHPPSLPYGKPLDSSQERCSVSF
jgi:hypothetical protein